MRIFTSALFFIVVNICFADLQIVLPEPINKTLQQKQLSQNTIASVHQDFNNHKYSCEQFISSYLNKIKKYNLALNRGAPLNAYVAINPAVIQQARELDNYHSQNSHFIGPLHCIPVIIKDNIDSIDTPSTSGSLALLGSQPNKDAVLVKRLKSAGAIIMGKGTMDEFASGVTGISSRSGRVGNAYAPNQNPGGSSSGPAVAVSADLAMIGIGTDNSGSVRIPAVFNGIYGLRPSTSSISNAGIFPRGNLDGVPGPLARNVKDLAIVYSVIKNQEVNSNLDLTPDLTADNKRSNSENNITITDTVKLLDTKALYNKRIGFIQSIADEPTVDKQNVKINSIFQDAIDLFKSKQAIIVPITLPNFNIDRANNTAGEVSEINQYLNSFPSTRKSFTDICNSNRTKTFGTTEECLSYAEKNPEPNGKIYNRTLQLFKTNRAYVERIMHDQHLDALLIPISKAGRASYDMNQFGSNELVSSNTGLPAVTIIAGYADASSNPGENNQNIEEEITLPVGMELIGKMYDEAGIINMAYAFEQVATNFQAPDLGEPENNLFENFSIAQLNNLFTKIGNESYQQILKNGENNDLTPDRFSAIVAKSIADDLGILQQQE